MTDSGLEADIRIRSDRFAPTILMSVAAFDPEIGLRANYRGN